jgi:predicted AlkP superfamily pyrophosphatase or phosphodiesterase
MKRPLRWIALLSILAAVFWGAGCATTPASAPTPPLLLISLDAFRWDYCAKYPEETPHLQRLIANGCSARALIPVYPSNTFPNHYTIVTGLYPAHHGIINNEMFDASTQTFFRYTQPKSVHESQWWGGEPIWVTAIKQGHAGAAYFWVGSEAAIEGVYPSFWKPYNYSIPFEQRLNDVIQWMRLPAPQRPAVIAFYLEETNSVGHKFGPDSKEIAAAVKLLDAHVGAMLARFRDERIPVNVVIVSDHGMTAISPERVVLLDDYLDLSSIQIEFYGSVVGLRPLEGSPESVVRALSTLPHAQAVLARDLPERFHLKDNPRIPPVWVMVDEGWQVDSRKHFESVRARYSRGDHGYDPALPSMQGILIAHGPSFKAGVTVDRTASIHVYNLLCAALKLKPAPNDGDNRLVDAFLRPEPAPASVAR